MKKFFSFLGKLFSAITLLGVAFYCVGYFFYSKTKKLGNLLSSENNNEEE
ncbi:MAG: hypothetical protein IIV97_05015 [Oscillospiraceae bacterium]|nr:hypothetical protein [Oscillospiraceae bacterium]